MNLCLEPPLIAPLKMLSSTPLFSVGYLISSEGSLGTHTKTKQSQSPSSLDLLGEGLEDGLLEGLGLGGAGPAALDLAVAADEELFKVPLDALEAEEARLLLLEPGPERAGAVAVDLGLLHDGEGDAVVDLAEALDLLVGPGLLGAELVAGEAEDDKVVRVLLLDLGPELLEAGVLRGEAALGGRVDDENHLALVVGQGDLLAALLVMGMLVIVRV